MAIVEPITVSVNWNASTVTLLPGIPQELPGIPQELTVCQICGVEGVIVFCGECKGILQLARKEWAKTIMREIEDDLS